MSRSVVSGNGVLVCVGMDITREKCINQVNKHIFYRMNNLDFYFVTNNSMILIHCPSSLSSELEMPSQTSRVIRPKSSNAGMIFNVLPSDLLSGRFSPFSVSFSHIVSEPADSTPQSQLIETSKSLARSIRFCISGLLASLSQSDTAWRVTPRHSASFSCVILFSCRLLRMLLPMLKSITS